MSLSAACGDVQIDDLLGREPIKLDDKNLHDFLTGRTVMVTGAGGSIGSELVRQIVNYGPKRILLVERAEFFLFQIEREMAGLGDVRIYASDRGRRRRAANA